VKRDIGNQGSEGGKRGGAFGKNRGKGIRTKKKGYVNYLRAREMGGGMGQKTGTGRGPKKGLKIG